MQTSTPNPLLQNGEQWITVNGLKHWCKVAGVENGTTPLVIVHGGPGGNLYSFERMVGPHLEQEATVVYYEQRGCGRTEKPADSNDYSMPLLVAEMDLLRQELGLQTIIPVGFSFGGWLALEYALAHPEHVEKVILIGPTNGDHERINTTQISSFKFAAQGEIRERVYEILNTPGTPEEHLDRIRSVADVNTWNRLLFHQPAAAKINRQYWEKSGLTNTGDMHFALLKQPAPRLLDRLPQLSIPTLCVVGLHDRNTGVEMARDIVYSLPDAQLIIFEHSAHFPDSEEPERFTAVVKEFISR